MKLLATFTTMFSLAAFVPAQGKTNEVDYRSKINKRVLEMRKKMREGKVRKYNVYVHVRLKNNNKLKGVVKNGQFIEAHDGLDFVPAARNQAHAGLRIWFASGTNSFIFVPYESIARYKIGRTLSDDQVKTIERGIVARRRAEQERYRQLAAKRKAAKGGKGTGAKTDAKPADIAVPELTKEQAALLAEFPAKDGWSEKKRDTLKARRITVGVFPNEKEKRFEEVFEKWKSARDQQVKIDAAKLAKSRADAKKKAAGSVAPPAPGTPGSTTKPAQPPKGSTPMPGK